MTSIVLLILTYCAGALTYSVLRQLRARYGRPAHVGRHHVLTPLSGAIPAKREGSTMIDNASYPVTKSEPRTVDPRVIIGLVGLYAVDWDTDASMIDMMPIPHEGAGREAVLRRGERIVKDLRDSMGVVGSLWQAEPGMVQDDLEAVR